MIILFLNDYCKARYIKVSLLDIIYFSILNFISTLFMQKQIYLPKQNMTRLRLHCHCTLTISLSSSKASQAVRKHRHTYIASPKAPIGAKKIFSN